LEFIGTTKCIIVAEKEQGESGTVITVPKKLFRDSRCISRTSGQTKTWRRVRLSVGIGSWILLTEYRRHVTFVDKDGDEHTFEVADGDNLLDIAQANDLEMEGMCFQFFSIAHKLTMDTGACGGSCACSTCHVIVTDEAFYDKMAEPDDEENDMLDLAFGLTETSRLGCQVKMSKELDGLIVQLPKMTRNLQASDFNEKK
jgi:ferredoxin